MRTFTIILPLLLSIAGFVLAMIAIFAGNKPGSLEDFHIIAINMSNFGHDLVPTPTTGSKGATKIVDRGFGDFFTSVVASASAGIGGAASSAAAILDDIEDDVADKLAQKLGIEQWYSLHVMTACRGNFAPNATSPGAWYNTTNCTEAHAGFQFNLTEVIDHEISVGPLHFNTAQLKIPDDINDAVRYLNSFLMAMFVFLCLGAGFSGLTFLGCIAALTMRQTVGGIAWGNTAFAALAALTLMVSAAITTGIARKGEQEINDKGSKVGISANAGTNFIIITWVAFATMFLALIYWIVAACSGRRSKTRRGHDVAMKETSRHSADNDYGRTYAGPKRFSLPKFSRRAR